MQAPAVTASHLPSVEVCVRGGGAVGMACALSLARQGLSVALVQPPAAAAAAPLPAAADVRTYALNPASRALLQALRVWDAMPADAVTAVEDMAVCGDRPGAQIAFSAWQQHEPALAWIVDAAELERALRLATRFAPHLQTVAAPPPAALTVLAEGKDSAGRAERGVRFDRHPYDQTALAARLVADRPHGQVARQWFQSPDVLALLPFDRPQPGHGYGLVWSLSPQRAAEYAALPAEAFEGLLMQATGGAAGGLRLAGERACWPLAVAQADRLCGPGWVLVGDAAHQVHPLAGQGLNLGLADVAALGQVLADRAAREPWRPLGDERLLRRYERLRAGPNRAMAAMTDGLQRLFAHPHALARELRNHGLTLLDALPPLKRGLAAQALGR